jgi:pimeloyl-ACP methyl ester carboxylesterase
MEMSTSITEERNPILYKTTKVDNLDIFYREAGSRKAPTILLLHGFPTSSHMFRNLIMRLSDKFHLVAPDYPGFGNSSAPPVDVFDCSFDHIAEIIEKLAQQHMRQKRFSMYVQDYGAPVGFRIASKHPEWIESLIIQNGNAYEEGLGPAAFELLKEFSKARTDKSEQSTRSNILKPDFTKMQYIDGASNAEKISPDSWNMDQYFLNRTGNAEIQIQLLYDYQNNLERYPEWQSYFRQHQPSILVVWGKNDKFFTQEGALAYKRDLKNIEVHFLDSGHFALEEEYSLISNYISAFFGKAETVHSQRE